MMLAMFAGASCVRLRSPVPAALSGRWINKMIEQLFSLAGKTALVTGGNGGIGRAIRLAFQAAGANVAVTGRSAEKNTAIGAELGPDGLVCSMDVRDEDEVGATVDKVMLARFGAVHILVNNAGNVSLENVLEMPKARWRRRDRDPPHGGVSMCAGGRLDSSQTKKNKDRELHGGPNKSGRQAGACDGGRHRHWPGSGTGTGTPGRRRGTALFVECGWG